MPPRLPPCSVGGGSSWILRLRLLFWLGRCGQLPPVLFSVSGLSALVPVVQVCLQAAVVFCLVDSSLSVALSGAPGFQSSFSFSSAPFSLSRPFLLQPLAPGILLVRACFCLGYFRGLDCPSPSHGGLPIGIPAFLSGSLPVALSHLPGGVRLFCFAGRTSSPFFWFVRGVRCSYWLSPLHSARFWFVVFSVPCGWVGALLPSLRPCTRSLSLSMACWLFPRFFCHAS